MFSFEHLFARRSLFRPSSLLNKSFAAHRTQNNAHEMSTGHPNRPSATKEEFLVKINYNNSDYNNAKNSDENVIY